jgi:ATPase family AAA domain-containing protein 3A/B
MSGWLWKKPTPQQEVNNINVDHLPENLRPKQPDFAALGLEDLNKAKDLRNQLSAHQQNAGQGGQTKMAATGIDADGLERAAKAARELDNSKNVQAAVDLAKEAEQTKRLETTKQIEAYKVQIAQAEQEKIRIRGEEQRKTQEASLQIRKEEAKFQDSLARRRDEDKAQRDKQTQAEILKAQEDSINKQEQLRRETLMKEMELRRENDMAKAEAEAKFKAQYDKENHEIKMEQIRLEQKEKNKGMKERAAAIINGVGNMVGNAFATPEQALRTVGYAGFGFMALYGAKHSTSTIGKVMTARLMEPELVRKTNKISVSNMFFHPIKSGKQLQTNYRKGDIAETIRNKIVVNPGVAGAIHDIGVGAENTIKNSGFLRNVLLHGPPGTGKTLFAENLALNTNMKYAIISGGDIAPMGEQGPEAMHKLFDWADTTKGGVILFIDEADAFLQKRNAANSNMSENMRATVNAFLQRTGTPSSSIMVVLASNQPEQLDWAVSDRMDTAVFFPLPTFNERLRLINLLYNDKILDGVMASDGKKGFFGKSTGGRTLGIEDAILSNQEQLMNHIATETEGLSGRQIDKMVTAWAHSMYADIDGQLKTDDIEKCLNSAKNDHATRMNWSDDFEKDQRNKQTSN